MGARNPTADARSRMSRKASALAVALDRRWPGL